MFTAIQQKIRRMVFLEHRPEQGEVFLNQRRVFTLPSKPGLAFLLLLVVLFIGATNYNLSLGFALTFVLASSGWVSVFFAFRNLAYLHLAAGPASPVFAGEEAQFPLYLINRRRNHRYAIYVGFSGKSHPQQSIDIAPDSRTAVILSCATQRRGVLPIPRVQLQTWFPMGLLRAWSTWLPDAQVIVYPQPELNPPPLPYASSAEKEGDGAGGDDYFSGVRAYQHGDPLKQLAWKHIARIDTEAGGQLISKQFSGGATGDLMIDFNTLPRYLDVEVKLSRMTSWVLQAEADGSPYGFRLGQHQYPPALGQAHQLACLQALALHEVEAT